MGVYGLIVPFKEKMHLLNLLQSADHVRIVMRSSWVMKSSADDQAASRLVGLIEISIAPRTARIYLPVRANHKATPRSSFAASN